MSKKVLCTLLVAAMAASVFASCGSSGGSSSKPDSSSKADTSASESGSSEASSEESSSAAYVPNFDEAPYTVHFQYCVAAEGSGQTGVNEAVDELAMKELNMHVEMIPQTMGTWATTMSMTLAANEPLDLFLAGSGSFGTYIDS